MKHRFFIGSTLLELLIILVITGLLVQLAVPQYQAFVEKAQARERLADLLSLQTEMESCYLTQMDYRVCGQQLGSPASGMLEKTVERFKYQLALIAFQSDVPCYRFETDDAHEMGVFNSRGESQGEGCL